MESILILDFGSQYTKLIARRVREQKVYCEIVPATAEAVNSAFANSGACSEIKGIILSGSPSSVLSPKAPMLPQLPAGVPVLGICYGAQLLAHISGGKVESSSTREYGRAELSLLDSSDPLLSNLPPQSQVWMSHSDSISLLPQNYKAIASTTRVANAAYRVEGEAIWGLQFHPEVHHSEFGAQILANFVHNICACSYGWTSEDYAKSTIASLKAQLGGDKVVMGLSGGVDSTVAATLLHRAIGDRLYCIFVDSGLLRKGEFESVLAQYQGFGLQVKGVRAGDKFLGDLRGITDPEAKRKIIGRDFVDVFKEEARKIEGVSWLGQGTIYPDVIESSATPGASVTIKSHHNVGGLPKDLGLNLVEPLRPLFKDEVRRVGAALGLPEELLNRHPFPGPGLGIRVLGEVTPEKVAILQEADAIYMQGLRDSGLYKQVWQAGTILLPIKSVGVMGDERTYEYTIVLRAVNSVDGMTADWSRLPHEFLAKMSDDIIRKVRGVNRVVYDVSSKPPATIEWE